jgi:hypothetical protein
MQTLWSGYAVPSMGNMTWTEVFVPRSLTVQLSDTAHVPTRITLPGTTHAVCLWSVDASVWYALDSAPGPIPPTATGTVIAETAFMLGGVLLPNAWQLFVLPNDSLPHSLYLVSESASPFVLLTVLTEMP